MFQLVNPWKQSENSNQIYSPQVDPVQTFENLPQAKRPNNDYFQSNIVAANL